MKYFRPLHAILALPLVLAATVLWREAAVSQVSRFEGYKIKRIEFIGVVNNQDGTRKYGPIYNKSYDELAALCRSYDYVDQPLNSEIIRGDIQRLVRDGNMLDVTVYVAEESGGVTLRFYCEEGSVVSAIEFRGSGQVRAEDVTSMLPIRATEPYRLDYAEAGRGVILNHLIQEKGLFNATVSVKAFPETDRPNAVRVVYTIDEGEEIKVARINLLGVSRVFDHEIRAFMATKPQAALDQGDFKRDKFEEDKQKIIAFYRQAGYLDAEIVDENRVLEWNDPEKTENRLLYITLRINEGERYYFDGYAIQGNTIIDTPSLEKNFQLPQRYSMPLDSFLDSTFKKLKSDTDIIFDDMKFQQDRMSINTEYGNRGYLFTRIVPEKKVNEREVTIEGRTERRKYLFFTFRIAEGRPVDVENIIIKGNKKTLDKVIRREILVKEGELYNQAKLNISRERIYALGYFKEVNIDIRPGSNDQKVNIVMSVVEQATGNISMGGGVGTNTGFNVQAKVGENNLMGTGRKVEVSVEYGAERASASVSFTEPWLMDRPVALWMQLFYSTYQANSSTPYFENVDDNDEYRQNTFGYGVGLTRRFWLYYGAGLKWRHSFKNITDVSGNCSDEIMKVAALGYQEKRSLSANIYYNSVDHPMLSTKGLNLDFEAKMVGGYLLRGEDHYMEYTASANWYYSPFSVPFLPRNRCVIELRGSGDFIRPPFMRSSVAGIQNNDENPWLEESDRLSIGGPESLRGWAYDDSDLPQSWQDNLHHRILYGAEFRVPLIFEYVWTSFFFDAGSLWTDSFWQGKADDEQAQNIRDDREAGEVYPIGKISDVNVMEYFRYSYGFGIKVQIPMMPLRFWWGKKLEWAGADEGMFREVDGKWNFQFQIGDIRF